MSHKTKVERQQEAKERTRPFLSLKEESLRKAVDYAAHSKDSEFAQRDLTNKVDALKRAYAEAGYERAVINGLVNAILEKGPLGSWLSPSVTHDTLVKLTKSTYT